MFSWGVFFLIVAVKQSNIKQFKYIQKSSFLDKCLIGEYKRIWHFASKGETKYAFSFVIRTSYHWIWQIEAFVVNFEYYVSSYGNIT